jgi:SAM-dependent methyltransferase
MATPATVQTDATASRSEPALTKSTVSGALTENRVAAHTQPAQVQVNASTLIDSLPEVDGLWSQIILEAEAGRFSPSLIEEHDFGIFRDAGDLYVRRELTPGEEFCINNISGRVLELGAGFGRVSSHLRERGVSVITTDADPALVQMYRARGWTDACALALPEVPHSLGKFDAVIALRGVLGSSGEIDAVYESLARIREVLNPGGRLIISSSRVNTLFVLPGRSPLEYRIRFIYRGQRSTWLRFTALPEWLAIPFLKRLGFINVQVLEPAISDGAGYYVFAQVPAE